MARRHLAMPRQHLNVDQTKASPSERMALLRDLLHRLRDEEVHKLQELIRGETKETFSVPGDQLDEASQNQQTEFQASLIDMWERRLAAIFSAFDRLDDGKYGICEECGEQISFERLLVIPTAVYCLDCQRELEATTPQNSH